MSIPVSPDGLLNKGDNSKMSDNQLMGSPDGVLSSDGYQKVPMDSGPTGVGPTNRLLDYKMMDSPHNDEPRQKIHEEFADSELIIQDNETPADFALRLYKRLGGAEKDLEGWDASEDMMYDKRVRRCEIGTEKFKKARKDVPQVFLDIPLTKKEQDAYDVLCRPPPQTNELITIWGLKRYNEFLAESKEHQIPVIIIWSTSWQRLYKKISRQLNEFIYTTSRLKVKFVFFDLDYSEETMVKYELTGSPVFYAYKGGKEIAHKVATPISQNDKRPDIWGELIKFYKKNSKA